MALWYGCTPVQKSKSRIGNLKWFTEFTSINLKNSLNKIIFLAIITEIDTNKRILGFFHNLEFPGNKQDPCIIQASNLKNFKTAKNPAVSKFVKYMLYSYLICFWLNFISIWLQLLSLLTWNHLIMARISRFGYLTIITRELQL